MVSYVALLEVLRSRPHVHIMGCATSWVKPNELTNAQAKTCVIIRQHRIEQPRLQVHTSTQDNQTWSQAFQQLCPSLDRPAPPPTRQPPPATFCGGRYATLTILLLLLLNLINLITLWLFTTAIIAIIRCIDNGSHQIINVVFHFYLPLFSGRIPRQSRGKAPPCPCVDFTRRRVTTICSNA